MQSKFKNIILGFFTFCLIGLFHCKKEFVIPEYLIDEYVNLGTHQLHARSYGQGSNTVIFENGLGTNMRVWIESEILQTIGKDTEAIAYNRAGTKQSTVGPDPRDLPTLIEDLQVLITSVADNKKVILVGHSLGGAVIRAYAIKYPEKVKAILFVEASHEDFWRISEDDERGLIAEIKKKDASRLGTIQEAAQIIENAEYLRSLPNLPDIPTIAMTSVRIEDGLTEGYVKSWSDTQKKLGEGLSDFKQIETTKSGHNIHTDEPNLVIDAIRELMSK